MHCLKFDRIKRVNQAIENRYISYSASLEVQRRRYLRKMMQRQVLIRSECKKFKEEKFRLLMEKQMLNNGSMDKEADFENQKSSKFINLFGSFLSTDGLLHGTGIHDRYERTKLLTPHCMKNSLEGNSLFQKNKGKEVVESDKPHDSVQSSSTLEFYENNAKITSSELSTTARKNNKNLTQMSACTKNTEARSLYLNNGSSSSVASLSATEEKKVNTDNEDSLDVIVHNNSTSAPKAFEQKFPNILLGQQLILRRQSEPKRPISLKPDSHDNNNKSHQSSVQSSTSAPNFEKIGSTHENCKNILIMSSTLHTSSLHQKNKNNSITTTYTGGILSSIPRRKTQAVDEDEMIRQKPSKSRKISEITRKSRLHTAPERSRLSVVKKQVHNHEEDYVMALRKKRQQMENQTVSNRVWMFIGQRPITANTQLQHPPNECEEDMDDISPNEQRDLLRKMAILSRSRR